MKVVPHPPDSSSTPETLTYAAFLILQICRLVGGNGKTTWENSAQHTRTFAILSLQKIKSMTRQQSLLRAAFMTQIVCTLMCDAAVKRIRYDCLPPLISTEMHSAVREWVVMSSTNPRSTSSGSWGTRARFQRVPYSTHRPP